MDSTDDQKIAALRAAAHYGIAAVIFRNALAKRQRLTLTESLCLTMLGTRGPATPTAIARFTGLTSGATTTMLDRLEKRRLVVRKRNPADRRGVIVEVDERAPAEGTTLVADIRTAHQRVIDRYSEGELAVITDFLERFAGNMEEHAALLEGEGGDAGM